MQNRTGSCCSCCSFCTAHTVSIHNWTVNFQPTVNLSAFDDNPGIRGNELDFSLLEHQIQKHSIAYACYVPQADCQTLLSACIDGTGGRSTSPLGVLRIQQLQQSLSVIAPFSGTLRHLILPELTGSAIVKLPAVVTALTGLQVHAACRAHDQ